MRTLRTGTRTGDEISRSGARTGNEGAHAKKEKAGYGVRPGWELALNFQDYLVETPDDLRNSYVYVSP
jgi:hypothetical protein